MTFHLIPELTIKAKIAYPRNRYARNSTLVIQLVEIDIVFVIILPEMMNGK
jgi:hypothetical protein